MAAECMPRELICSQVGGGSRLRCLRGSLPENQYEYDDEDKDAKRDIHIILSGLHGVEWVNLGGGGQFQALFDGPK